jgi:hypothetical protein
MLLILYLFGVIMTLIYGFNGIRRHITFKGILGTLLMSIFSWITIWYIMGTGKNYNK